MYTKITLEAWDRDKTVEAKALMDLATKTGWDRVRIEKDVYDENHEDD